MTAAVKVPHVHAEVIRAWADGAQVECQNIFTNDYWVLSTQPLFSVDRKYRIKLEPPARIYPATGMTGVEMSSAWCEPSPNSTGAAMESLANAALRHAVDAGQILTLADHHAEIAAFGEKLRDAAIERERTRDTTVAVAVRNACRNMFTAEALESAISISPTMVYGRISSINIAAIIAKVPTC